jgi:hypothetical protein
MRTFASLLLLTTLLSMSALGQEAFYGFAAHLRVDNNPTETLSVSLRPGEVRVVDLGNQIHLEFTAPEADSAEQLSMVRLLGEEDAELRVLATTRSSPTSNPRVVGYLICDGQVTFMSPPPEDIPSCQS